MSVRRDFSCGCPSRCPGTDTARFCLLGVLIALYMLAGAAVFSSLERSAELKAHQLWERRLREFRHAHNISFEDIKSLLRHYEEARTAGIRTEGGRALWDIPGAFYFVGTVLSTIGFGVTAPSTMTGKVLLVFYGLLGCSATILFFNLFLERVITLLNVLISCCQRSGRRQHGRLEGSGGEGDGKKESKPSVYHVALVLFVAVLAVACGAAFLYSAMEDWTYLESLYFCFVAFSTVGFGDMVSGQRKHHEEARAYQVANCLLILFGVCCAYSLFNAISVIIKLGLNSLIGMLVAVKRNMCRCKLKRKPLFESCSSESEAPVCHCETQHVQAVSGSSPTMHWRSSVPNTIDKCRCEEANVEIVCHRNSYRGLAAIPDDNEENPVNGRPLPL